MTAEYHNEPEEYRRSYKCFQCAKQTVLKIQDDESNEAFNTRILIHQNGHITNYLRKILESLSKRL